MKSVFLDSFINRHFWLSYARIRVIFTASGKADDIVRLTRITAESEDAGKVKNFFMKFIYEIEDIYRFFL